MARPLDWQLATVAGVRDETDTVRSFSLTLPAWTGHRPGQHVDLRLTAEDGYSVERSYSIASEPERSPEVDITVERIPDGEVSPFLHDVVIPGDRLEVRGPIGGYFVWEASQPGPLLLVGGGAGLHLRPHGARRVGGERPGAHRSGSVADPDGTLRTNGNVADGDGRHDARPDARRQCRCRSAGRPLRSRCHGGARQVCDLRRG